MMVVDDVDFLSRAQDMRNGLALEVGIAVCGRHCGDLRRALFDLGETEGQLGRPHIRDRSFDSRHVRVQFLTQSNRSGERAPAGFR